MIVFDVQKDHLLLLQSHKLHASSELQQSLALAPAVPNDCIYQHKTDAELPETWDRTAVIGQ